MGNLQVINNTDNKNYADMQRAMRTGYLCDLWEQQYHSAVHKAFERWEECRQDDLMKIALAGVKYANLLEDVGRENKCLGTGYIRSLEESKAIFDLIDSLFNIIGRMTVGSLVIAFPIDKDFEGHKWECKDYFYTRDIIDKMDNGKPIGRETLSELLWDYMNRDLRNLYVLYMSVTSDLYKAKNGVSMMEQFFMDHNLNVPSYSINDDIGLMKNRQTGEIIKLDKRKSNLTVIS